MSLAELLAQAGSGRSDILIGIYAFPGVVFAVAYALLGARQVVASQWVANLGIAVGLVTLLVEVCIALTGGRPNPLLNAHILAVLGPVYLLVAGVLVERWLHPGPQLAIRTKALNAGLVVLILGVVYFVLSRMRIHMLVFSSVFGLLLFMGAIVAVLYVLMRGALLGRASATGPSRPRF